MEEAPSLRVLVADGIGEHLELITKTVTGLGHEVIARESSPAEVAHLTASERPDVALVIVSQGTTHALEMIDQIVHEAACPVIAILHVQDRRFVMEAAKRGIFAYVVDGGDPEELQSAIDVVLKRFDEYHNLEGAFGGEPSPSGQRASSWSDTASVSRKPSICCVTTLGRRKRSWWTSRRPSLPGIRSCRRRGSLPSERERLTALRASGGPVGEDEAGAELGSRLSAPPS